MIVVRLTLAGLHRVTKGQVGMTFVVDYFMQSKTGLPIAHVRDYRYSTDYNDFQIWSIPEGGYEIIENVTTLEEQRRRLGYTSLAAAHQKMLDSLKTRFAAHDGSGGRQEDWELIHSLDPEWPNPWNDREPEIRDRAHATTFYFEGMRGRTTSPANNPYDFPSIAAHMWFAGWNCSDMKAALDEHYGVEEAETYDNSVGRMTYHELGRLTRKPEPK